MIASMQNVQNMQIHKHRKQTAGCLDREPRSRGSMCVLTGTRFLHGATAMF